MKVLFVYPDICSISGGFQQGIGILSSLLKKNGHEVSLLHLTKNISKHNFIREFKNAKPDLIAFSTTTNQYQFVELYSKWVKEIFDIPIVCGGVHCTMDPESVIQNMNIDILCIGEGENAMVDLAKRMENGHDIKNIQNLWIRDKGIVKKNPPGPLIEDLDSLPFPDRSIFDFKKILKAGKRADIMIGRGCPFSCSYCLNHRLMNIYKGKGRYVRIRSVNNVINEIREVTSNYDVPIINFCDDTCTLVKKWVHSFCKKYPEEFDIPFEINARVGTIDPETLRLLKEAGCREVRIGIESGNEWLRKNILSRDMTNKQIIDTFDAARKVGLSVYAYYMVGIPFETPEMAEDTIKLNRKIQPDFVQVSIFNPYPGTKLHEICEKNKFLREKNATGYFERKVVAKISTMSEKEILYYFDELNTFVFENVLKTKYKWTCPAYSTLSKISNKSAAMNIMNNLNSSVRIKRV